MVLETSRSNQARNCSIIANCLGSPQTNLQVVVTCVFFFQVLFCASIFNTAYKRWCLSFLISCPQCVTFLIVTVFEISLSDFIFRKNLFICYTINLTYFNYSLKQTHFQSFNLLTRSLNQSIGFHFIQQKKTDIIVHHSQKQF